MPKISVVADKYTIYCVPYDLPYKIVFLFALQLQRLLFMARVFGIVNAAYANPTKLKSF